MTLIDVTFSIVTAFKEVVLDAEGKETERSQCHISLAQRKASEFLIVTFSNDHDTVALLPHKSYWPTEEEESAAEEGAFSDQISASTLAAYSFSITLLLANIEEIKRITLNPMHPTTTLFQIGLDGRIPKASTPEAIMARASEQQATSSILDSPIGEETALRNMHKAFTNRVTSMKIDFLDYQPLLQGFKIVISSSEKFPDGLEVVINHSAGRLRGPMNNDGHHLEHADYLFYSIKENLKVALFVPRRLIPEAWFEMPDPPQLPELSDSGSSVSNGTFLFQLDEAGKWVNKVYNIICDYPPESPTPAENMQKTWEKALPWPEIKAQSKGPPSKDPSPQEAQEGEKQLSHRYDSGTGGHDAAKPSDSSLTLAHYMEKASLRRP